MLKEVRVSRGIFVQQARLHHGSKQISNRNIYWKIIARDETFEPASQFIANFIDAEF